MTLLTGDCREVMSGMDAESVDAVVTDPPYGLGFMGKEWDSGKSFVERKADRRNTFDHVGGNHNPVSAADAARTRHVEARKYGQWCEQWAAECLRVLKPGGYLLAFGGTRTYHRLACAVEDAGFEIRDSLHWVYGSGFPKGKACLKPAHEPIVLARKPAPRMVPFPGLDDCRVAASAGDYDHASNTLGKRDDETNWRFEARKVPPNDVGRWPPNILLTHAAECNGECVPGCPVAEMDAQSGNLHGSGNKSDTRAGADADYDASSFHVSYAGRANRDYGSAGGGASRFFPVFRYQAKASGKERPRLPDGTTHPTVKPLDLVRWLVRLVTPPGGLVLDPFAGTGTTGEACAVEGFRCVLIEQDPQAVELARVRLGKPVQPLMEVSP